LPWRVGYYLTVRPLKLAAYAVLGVGLLSLFPYLTCPVYRFAGPRPFRGAQFYNPYAGAGEIWRTANLHAHGLVWGGLTDGRQSDSAIVAHYHALGYDVAGISNYQLLDPAAASDRRVIPTYEHGYNLFKAHFLVLGARRVDWFDFPWAQTRDEKQYVIDRLKSSGSLVLLAHPSLRNAESLTDLHYLTHYDLIEVLNHFTVSDQQWDAALSSGHQVWAVGDDDTHNIDDPGQTGAMWTMIATRDLDRDSVLAALSMGRTIAVAGQGGASDVHVRSVVVHGDTLSVTCDAPVHSISFVGQQGRLLQRTRGGTSASYLLQPGDPYVRTVIVTPHTTMYLNPVLRYDGTHLEQPVAIFDTTATWSLRASVWAGVAILAWLVVIVSRLRLPIPIPVPVPEGAD
jgi:hypothetical protein